MKNKLKNMKNKKINLEDILFESKFKKLTTLEKEKIKDGLIIFEFDEIIHAMREACKKTLELAAEKTIELVDEKSEREWCSDGYTTGMWKDVIDEKSILEIIEQFKQII